MNREHEMIRVWPEQSLIECRCGHLDLLGKLTHLRLHHSEPTQFELERAWEDAISFAVAKLNEPND